MRLALALTIAAALWAPGAACATPEPSGTQLLNDFAAVCLDTLARPDAVDAAADRIGAWPAERYPSRKGGGSMQAWRHVTAARAITIMASRRGSRAVGPTCSAQDLKDAGASIAGLGAWLGVPIDAPAGAFADFELIGGRPRLVTAPQARLAAKAAGDLLTLVVFRTGDETVISIYREAPTVAEAIAGFPIAERLAASCVMRPDPSTDQAAYKARLEACVPTGSPEARLTSLLSVAGFTVKADLKRADFTWVGDAREVAGAGGPPCRRSCAATEEDLIVGVRWTTDAAGAIASAVVDWRLDTMLTITRSRQSGLTGHPRMATRGSRDDAHRFEAGSALWLRWDAGRLTS